MAEYPEIAAILAANVVGFGRMASADEDRTLAQCRHCAPPSSIPQ